MATPKIEAALLGDDDEQQKTNIFAPGAEGTAQQGEQAPGLPQQQVKTSTEGQVQGQGAQQQSQERVRSADAVSNAPSRELLRRNVGQQQAPTTLKDIESRLSGASQSLQQEADSYTKSQQKDYTLSSDDLEGAISGRQDAQQKFRSLYGEPEQAEAFTPQTSVDIAPNLARAVETRDDNAIGSAVQNFLRRESGPQYNTSEANLDYQLLRRQPDFMKTIEQLGRSQRDLEGQASRYQQELPQTVAEQRRQAAEQARVAAEQGLSEAEKALIAQNEAEMNAFKEQLASQSYEDFSAGALDPLVQKYANDPFIANLISSAGVDPSQFYQAADTGALGYQEFLDEGEAQRFNSIMDLLGRAGQSFAAGSQGAGLANQFDVEGYRSAAEQAALAKESAHMKSINDLIGAGQAGLDKYRSGPLSDAAVQAMINRELAGMADIHGSFGGGISGMQQNAYGLDPQSYVNYGDARVYGVEDFLTKEQFAQLDALSKERGIANPYAMMTQDQVVEPKFRAQDYYNDYLSAYRADQQRIRDEITAKQLAANPPQPSEFAQETIRPAGGPPPKSAPKSAPSPRSSSNKRKQTVPKNVHHASKSEAEYALKNFDALYGHLSKSNQTQVRTVLQGKAV